MTAALSLRSVRVQYGLAVAVEDFSLDVHTGEIVALLGPNGSGKSTTLSVAAGLQDPISGAVFANGHPRLLDPMEYARHIGYVPQDAAVYDELSATGNLHFFGRLYGLRGTDLAKRIDRMLTRFRLTDRASHRVGTFSGGLKQRLNLAAALLHDPDVLLLDEPTAALDPASRESLFADLQELREEGRAILVTTHHLDEAEAGCDRVVVLDRGRVVANGSPAELRSSCDRAVLYAQLSERVPSGFEVELQRQIGLTADVEITGRRLRLAADMSEELGRALAEILASGLSLHSFRTPPGPLEGLLRGQTMPASTIERRVVSS